MPRKKSDTKKRPEGSLRTVAGGAFEARCTVRDLTKRSGKAERSKRFPTREQAAAWLAETMGRAAHGTTLPRARDGFTLEQWLRECYVVNPPARMAPQTIAADWAIATRYIIRAAPALASQRLADLTATDCTEHFHLLARRGGANGRALSRLSLHRVYGMLAARLNDATHARERTGLVASPLVPFGRLGLRVPPDRVMRRLSASQLAAVLVEAPHVPYGEYLAFLALTGVRPSEAAGLRWDDLALDAARVQVGHALVRLPARGGWILDPTKTRTSRTLELAPALVALLTAHRARQRDAAALLGSEYHDHGLVFASTFGEPLHVHTLRNVTLARVVGRAACRLLGRALPPLRAPSSSVAYRAEKETYDAAVAAAIADADLGFVTLYTFRRTAASVLMEIGASLLAVQSILGHARSSTTDIYVKRLQDRAAEGSTALAQHVGTFTPPAVVPDPAPVVPPLRLVREA